MTEYVAAPTSRKKIREAANFLRKSFGLTDVEYFPVVEFFEGGLSQIDKDYNYEIVPVEEMPNKHGLTTPGKHLIQIREDVYLGAVQGNGRDRFTIAHEIGHFLMHRSGSISLARTNSKETIPAYKQPEWQANTFAGELLAPPHIIKGLTIEEIKKRCGVSESAGFIQLNQI